MEEKIFDSEFFQKLNTLKISTKMKLNAGMSGGRKSTAKGSSVEFSDFREYMLGDDIRRIDWNAYGRMDKLFVKLFMEEKEGLFHIFLDCSKSMDYGAQKKSVLAQRIVGTLSYMILNNLDRVYIHTIKEEKVETSGGMTGRQSFRKLLLALESVTFEGTTNLPKGILSKEFKRSGVTILVSDFFDKHNLEDALKYLAYKKQEIILIHVLANEEVHPNVEGILELIDSETIEHTRVTVTNQVVRAYEKALEQFRNYFLVLSKKYKITYIPVVTEESFDSFLSLICK